jgi:hypothetical protein
LFGKKTLVDALLDRLQHHCITIEIDGPSLRAPEPEPQSDAPTSAKKTSGVEENIPASARVETLTAAAAPRVLAAIGAVTSPTPAHPLDHLP